MKNSKGITLISLVITIVVLVILSAVAIYLTLGNNGILSKAEQAKNETTKQAATEKMNLKITNMQIETYAEEQRMPTLQEFSDGLCEDNEIEYVQLQSKKVGSLSKIEVGKATSIFTKLKEYPYEFEINSSLQLASIDGIQVATGKYENKIYKVGTYSAESVNKGANLATKLTEINTIDINIKEKYNNYQKLTIDNFFATEIISFDAEDTSSNYICYGNCSTVIKEYDNITGVLTIVKPFGYRDDASDSLDECYLGTTSIYIIENSQIIDL